jgi:hypothetical protein
VNDEKPGTVAGTSARAPRSGKDRRQRGHGAMDTYPIDSPEVSLERLEASIQETLNRLIDRGCCTDEHREHAAEFRRRLQSLRERLDSTREAVGRVEMPAETKSDFDLLAWDFKRWLTQVDEEFQTGSGPRAPRT